MMMVDDDGRAIATTDRLGQHVTFFDPYPYIPTITEYISGCLSSSYLFNGGGWERNIAAISAAIRIEEGDV